MINDGRGVPPHTAEAGAPRLADEWNDRLCDGCAAPPQPAEALEVGPPPPAEVPTQHGCDVLTRPVEARPSLSVHADPASDNATKEAVAHAVPAESAVVSDDVDRATLQSHSATYRALAFRRTEGVVFEHGDPDFHKLCEQEDNSKIIVVLPKSALHTSDRVLDNANLKHWRPGHVYVDLACPMCTQAKLQAKFARRMHRGGTSGEAS